MVSRQSFINKIHELKYVYKDTQKRTYLYRKKGGSHRIFVPMADKLEDEFVVSSLKQAGVPDAEIASFIASAKS